MILICITAFIIMYAISIITIKDIVLVLIFLSIPVLTYQWCEYIIDKEHKVSIGNQIKK